MISTPQLESSDVPATMKRKSNVEQESDGAIADIDDDAFSTNSGRASITSKNKENLQERPSFSQSIKSFKSENVCRGYNL